MQLIPGLPEEIRRPVLARLSCVRSHHLGLGNFSQDVIGMIFLALKRARISRY